MGWTSAMSRRLSVYFMVLVVLLLVAPAFPAQINFGNSAQSLMPTFVFPKFLTKQPYETWQTLVHQFGVWLNQITIQQEIRFLQQVGTQFWGFTNEKLQVSLLMPSVHASSIAVDQSCTATGSSSSSISCSLNHAANVLIIVYAIINNVSNHGGSLTGVTIGGLPKGTPLVGVGNSSTFSSLTYYFYAPYASNDIVQVNYSGASNNTEAMVAISFTGTNNHFPLYNDRAQQNPGTGTSTSLTVAAGEANRFLVDAVYVNSNASITAGSSQTQINQVNTAGASIEVDYRTTPSSVTLTSSWIGSTNRGALAFAILPIGQILSDASQSIVNATSTGNISNSISGTLPSVSISAEDICVVGVSILETSGQTVSSIQQANGNTSSLYGMDQNYTFLSDASHGNVRTELWFTNDGGSLSNGTGTITVTLSASANAVMVLACFSGSKQNQLFEGLTTNTGNSGTASSGNITGANTTGRRILLLAGFAANSIPVGSQGVDQIATSNSNGLGLLLNYYDTSNTTNMQATDSSSQWAAIGVALLPYPITVDATCSTTTATSSTTSCSLNHSAGVLILIFAGNIGTDTISSVKVGGNSATIENLNNSSSGVRLSVYTYYSTNAASDSVVVTWTNHNSNESLTAISLLGTIASAPFINALRQANGNGTQSASDAATGGVANSFQINVIESASINNYFAVLGSAQNAAPISEVNGNSNSMAVFGIQSFGNRTPDIEWGTSAIFADTVFRVNPSNQVVLDGITGGGSTGGQNVAGSSNVASSASTTCALPSHDPNVLVIVNVVLANGSSQTVNTVRIGGNMFTQLARVANGASVSDDLWYLWDTNSGAETITVIPSASAAIGVTCAAYANTANSSNCVPASNCFEQTAAAADNASGIASVTVGSGTSNREFLLTVGEGANSAIVGQQGVDWVKVASSTSGLSEDTNTFEAASNQSYSMTATFAGNNWAAIATGILPAQLQITTTTTTMNTTTTMSTNQTTTTATSTYTSTYTATVTQTYTTTYAQTYTTTSTGTEESTPKSQQTIPTGFRLTLSNQLTIPHRLMK